MTQTSKTTPSPAALLHVLWGVLLIALGAAQLLTYSDRLGLVLALVTTLAGLMTGIVVTSRYAIAVVTTGRR